MSGPPTKDLLDQAQALVQGLAVSDDRQAELARALGFITEYLVEQERLIRDTAEVVVGLAESVASLRESAGL